MRLGQVRVRALIGRTGPKGDRGEKGEDAYKTFKTYAEAAGSTGPLDETIIVAGDSGTHTDPVVGGTVSNSGRFARRAGGLERIDDYTATAQKFIISAVPPAAPTSGVNQIGMQLDTPNRDEAGAPSTVRFSLIFNHGPYAANSQGAGQPIYSNNVVGVGWNLAPALTLIDSTKGGPSIRIEHRFKVQTRDPANSGAWIDGSEFHHSMRTIGSGGIEFRPISIYAPFNTADWAYDSSISFQSAIYALADGHRNVHVTLAWEGTSTAPKQIFLSNKVRVNHEGNGSAWLYQNNAELNALLPLSYLNAQNHLQISQPIYAPIEAASANNALGIQSLLTLQGTSGFTTGARLAYVTANSITGSATCYEAELSASTRFEGFRVRNSHASGTSGGRIIGNGNLYLDFYREAAFKRWGMGLRSDDTFAIGQQEQGVEVADAIRINFTTLQTSFLYPPKLPSYTVAGLPNPTTVGAGSEAFCTNETGGAVPVFSDGTNWRRVTDRTIAA